jgi:hypothetical protein
MSKTQQTKEQLINQLLGLVNGSIDVNELKPKDLCICIGYGSDNVYLINNKPGTKEQFDEARALQKPAAFKISYGDDE